MSNEPDTTRSPSFLPLPAIAYSKVTGLELGLAGLYSFYSDRKDTLTRSSNFTGLATFTTKKQANFSLKADIWSPKNIYHYTGEIRYRNFPFKFYGIGDKTIEADEDNITQNLFRLTSELEKLLLKNYYGGVNVSFENYSFKDRETGGIYTTNPFILDKDGGKVLFFGLSQIFDSRNTNTYTTKGLYLKLNYSYAPDFFKDENFTGSLIKADARSFNSLSKKTVLGFNAVYQSLRGESAPFYLLPQFGSDLIMRGYYTGRYRNENLLALQTEFRYRFIPRLGAAAFFGMGTSYSKNSFKLGDLKPSYGGGLRYFFDVERGMNVRFDYALGEKRSGEGRQSSFYISFGEAF